MFERRFSGRTAIVTGGASGCGKAVAQRLIHEGASVVLWDRSGEALAASKEEIGAAHVVEVDVADPQAVAQAAKASQAALGKVDLLLCSAGITGPTVAAAEYPLDAWRSVIDVNLNGTFYCCRSVVPLMLANGYGRIVNIASIAGKEGNPNASAYSASKAGVIGFTKSLGKELASSRIIANVVAPATFNTPLLQQLPQSFIDYMKAKIPMARFAEVEEVASLICWLLSEECSFSTGAVFDLSGGRATY